MKEHRKILKVLFAKAKLKAQKLLGIKEEAEESSKKNEKVFERKASPAPSQAGEIEGTPEIIFARYFDKIYKNITELSNTVKVIEDRNDFSNIFFSPKKKSERSHFSRGRRKKDSCQIHVFPCIY